MSILNHYESKYMKLYLNRVGHSGGRLVSIGALYKYFFMLYVIIIVQPINKKKKRCAASKTYITLKFKIKNSTPYYNAITKRG